MRITIFDIQILNSIKKTCLADDRPKTGCFEERIRCFRFCRASFDEKILRHLEEDKRQ